MPNRTLHPRYVRCARSVLAGRTARPGPSASAGVSVKRWHRISRTYAPQGAFWIVNSTGHNVIHVQLRPHGSPLGTAILLRPPGCARANPLPTRHPQARHPGPRPTFHHGSAMRPARFAHTTSGCPRKSRAVILDRPPAGTGHRIPRSRDAGERVFGNVLVTFQARTTRRQT